VLGSAGGELKVVEGPGITIKKGSDKKKSGKRITKKIYFAQKLPIESLFLANTSQ